MQGQSPQALHRGLEFGDLSVQPHEVQITEQRLGRGNQGEVRRGKFRGQTVRTSA